MCVERGVTGAVSPACSEWQAEADDRDIAAKIEVRIPSPRLPPCDPGESWRYSRTMSATEATAEIFVTAFKALKSSERAAVWQKLVADTKLAEDLADTLALEARRRQPREPFRTALKALKIRV